jgi:hypothetical protein
VQDAKEDVEVEEYQIIESIEESHKDEEHEDSDYSAEEPDVPQDVVR